MMGSAQRHRELIADFEAEGTRLRKTQMMRVRWVATANKAWLRGDEAEMRFVPTAFWFGDGEEALIYFVELGRRRVGPCGRDRS